MASSPAFIATGVIGIANVATANTNKDGTGTITHLVTGAANGTRVLEIVAKAQVSTSAACVGIFLSTDSGTTWRLIDEIAVTAVASSATAVTFRNSRTYTNLVLKDATHRVGVTTTISQSTNVIGLGGDL